MADDYLASTATTGTLAVGSSITSNIDTTSDADWFRVALTAGRTYQFDLAGSATVHEPFLEVLNSSGNSLVSGDGFNADALVTFAPTLSGTYYLSAGSFGFGETGAYTLSAADVGAATDLYAGSTATTGTLAVGSSITSNIDTTSDADWFRVALTAGRTYQFDLAGSATVHEPFLEVLNSSGNSLVSGDGFNADALVTFAPTLSGTYYLSAGSFGFGETGAYTLSATDVGAATDLYAGSTATTGTLAIGASVTSNIDTTSDADWFRVTLTAGRTYQFDLAGSATVHEPFLEVLNSSGNSLVSGDGFNADALVTFAPTLSGTYYLSAGSFGFGETGAYTLSAADVGAATDLYAGSTATTGTLAIGASVTSNIDTTSDTDWFRVTLTAGRTYQFDLAGSATVHEPFLEVLNSSGNSLVSGDGFNADALVTFAPTLSGTYYLSAGSFGFGETGAYTLSAADVGAATDLYAGSTATTGTLAIGASVTSNIDTTSDTDWFRVTLTAGRTYQFDLAGSATVHEPFLEVLNSSGNSLVSGDGFNADALVTFAPTLSGTYYLSAGSFGFGETGAYTLSAADVTDGRPPTIASNGGGDSATVSIFENSNFVTTVHATDPDAGTTLNYSIVGGADASQFAIDGSSGALSFIAAPNFEVPTDADHNGSYIVQVRASDGSLTDDQTITVTVTGGIGNDTYVVNNTATTINDASGATDVVYAEGVSYSLQASATGIEAMIVENGTGLTGTGYSAAPNILYSLDTAGQSNTLIGGSAADYLSGGLGTDHLLGGAGNDLYVVHSTATTISDTSGTTDIAYVEGVDYSLADGDGVDYLVLEKGTGHTAIGHTSLGTTLYSVDTAGQSNTLIGGTGDDVLCGGLGADHLVGGDGNDTYAVYSAATTITDTGGATDVVYAESTDFALTDGDGIEALIADGTGHTVTGHATQSTSIYSIGTGNTLAGGSAQDILTAGAHGDTLIGNGGNDFLIGGAGNDTFQFGVNFGQDVVYNFQPHGGGASGDTIHMTNEAPGTTFASMVANNQIFEAPDPSQASGVDVIVEHDVNNYVTILNHHIVELSASDFLFA